MLQIKKRELTNWLNFNITKRRFKKNDDFYKNYNTGNNFSTSDLLKECDQHFINNNWKNKSIEGKFKLLEEALIDYTSKKMEELNIPTNDIPQDETNFDYLTILLTRVNRIINERNKDKEEREKTNDEFFYGYCHSILCISSKILDKEIRWQEINSTEDFKGTMNIDDDNNPVVLTNSDEEPIIKTLSILTLIKEYAYSKTQKEPILKK